jgi:hypothetical protein
MATSPCRHLGRNVVVFSTKSRSIYHMYGKVCAIFDVESFRHSVWQHWVFFYVRLFDVEFRNGPGPETLSPVDVQSSCVQSGNVPSVNHWCGTRDMVPWGTCNTVSLLSAFLVEVFQTSDVWSINFSFQSSFCTFFAPYVFYGTCSQRWKKYSG